MRSRSPRGSSTRRLSLAVLATVAAFCAPPAAADFASGMKAYLSGDYGIARRDWLAAADAGDHEAEFWLGMADLNGWGAPADPVKAARNFRFAAEAGHSDAQFNLAVLLRDVLGGSPAEVDDWLRKAASGGSAEAQAVLAERPPAPEAKVAAASSPPPEPKVEPKPETKVAVAPPPPLEPRVEPKPETKVAAAPPPPSGPKAGTKPEAKVAAAPPPDKVETAAPAEDAEALYKRGMAARSGLDEPQDLAKAVDLLTKAAERGHMRASYGLGAVHAVGGAGVPRDPVKAMMWMLVSQREGYREAEKGIGMLRPQLDQKRMEAASAQAEAWLSRHP